MFTDFRYLFKTIRITYGDPCMQFLSIIIGKAKVFYPHTTKKIQHS